MRSTWIDTPDGVFKACYSSQGLVYLEFPSARKSRGDQNRTGTSEAADSLADHSGTSRWDDVTKSALKQVLRGLIPDAMPPFDLTSGTAFQRMVWKVLCSIPPGQTMSYAQVAKAIDRPNATRAVGNACGANPIPVLIPCHRVLAARGRLGGFSSGLSWKIELLRREGIRPAE